LCDNDAFDFCGAQWMNDGPKGRGDTAAPKKQVQDEQEQGQGQQQQQQQHAPSDSDEVSVEEL
jgi:hypothetical protein